MTAQASLLSTVRQACAAVAARAVAVAIDQQRLDGYVASLPLDDTSQPELDPTRHYFGSPKDTLAYVVTLDAINFGSGYFPYLKKRPGMSGYFTVATSLKEHFDRHGPLSPEQLCGLSAERCAQIFGQDPIPGPALDLMGLFAEALGELGHFVAAEFDHSFVRLVESARHSASELVAILTQMSFYRDVARYHEMEVPFYKRAQITAADLSVALPDHPWGRFDDLNHLTIFADNLVPHVLRVDGVLRYDDKLASRIDAEIPITAGSPEEVEIRACGLHAVELLVQVARRQAQPINAMRLDYILWNRGQQPSYKARPRHRARSVYY